MARLARIVVPGVPHHVTQRGTRRLPVFFAPSDYDLYRTILHEQATRRDVEIWNYCLMPNHVHLIAAPSTESSLSRAIGEAHRKYACLINEREGWRGHLWQERFGSFPMDERHLRAAMRYVLLNPVRAGLVEEACDWPFSSARAHVLGTPDLLVNLSPAAERVADWSEYLESADPPETQAFATHPHAGRPLGSDRFLAAVEDMTGRLLRRRNPGKKRVRF